MNVIESEYRGFCPGVRRAVDVLAKARAENGSVALTGSLCHNSIVAARIGAPVFDAKSQDTPDACVVNAHGAARGMLAELASRGVRIYDAVCPNVRRIYDLIEGASGRIVYAGVAGHAERVAVESVFGDVKDIRFASDAGEVFALFADGTPPKVTLVAQSSFSSEKLAAIAAALGRVCSVEVIDTICPDCKARRLEAADLARECDFLMVVGDEASANANELAETARRHGASSGVILDAGHIPDGVSGTVGVISSASSPADIFAGVAQALREM